MSSPRLAALLCVAVHVAALTLPCQGSAPRDLPSHHTLGHEHAAAHDPHAACAPTEKLEAPCPCGCEERGVASRSLRLGWMDLPEVAELALALRWAPLDPIGVELPPAPSRGIDPVPI